jgi:alpha-mannosidase
MHLEKIHLERIRKFIARLKNQVYTDKTDLNAEYIYDKDEPIPYPDIDKHDFEPIPKGEVWGNAWGSSWFRFTGTVPATMAGKDIGAWIDVDGEACVWKNSSPWLGLTNKVDWYHNAGKYYVPISENAVSGEEIELLVEAAANDLFGSGKTDYKLVEASLVCFNKEIFHLVMDMEVLFNLAEHLPEKTARRQKILYGLNVVCNLWQEGKGIVQASEITQELLSRPANASALNAVSIGHAHIDLAWLWPVRETKRKGGRTFATALRMLETYPDYVFGASQAQLYKWIKHIYPELYKEIKQAVINGRWEVQGAGWVEFDTNLTGGESIIRQMFYGRRFFRQEFGISPEVLWLPDCFGFNANLPQLMRGCGVNFFMTQKLSWNESDTFPHHIFRWQGIDGSEVLAHQLPTNDYNFSNSPSAFLETEKRFAQSEVCDEFLNLYGIGDGGGGPGREHIEYGLRQKNLEGVPRFRFTQAQKFFNNVAGTDANTLPQWSGELYLQYHRGTYTTQALMKKNNRLSERLLHDAEFAAALTERAIPRAAYLPSGKMYCLCSSTTSFPALPSAGSIKTPKLCQKRTM